MDTPAEAEAPESPPRTLVVEKRRVRRTPGALFWLAVVALPVALTAFVGFTRGPAVEDDLAERTSSALSAAGLDGVTVAVDGRTVTAEVPTGLDPEEVEDTIAGVSGVFSVESNEVYASAKEAKACADLQRKIDRATGRQRIPFDGSSTRLTAAGSRMVREVAGLLKGCRAAEVLVGGHVDDSTVNGATISFERARVIIRLLRAAGIESERLEPRGYGTQFQVSDGDGAAARARNQRGSIAVKDQ